MKPEKKTERKFLFSFLSPSQRKSAEETPDFTNKNPLESSLRALDGLKEYTRCSRRNWLYQVLISAGIIAISFWVQLETVRFVLVLLCIALVLAIEILNTAIEVLLNWLQPEYDARVKRVKDLAAGAVLVVSLGAVSAGLLLFWAPLNGTVHEPLVLKIIGSVLIILLGTATLISGRAKG